MSDLQKPPWRTQPRQPGSTFQHWEFSTAPELDDTLTPPDTEEIKPEFELNPFALPVGGPGPWLRVRSFRPPATNWLPVHAGRTGVWRIESPDFMFGRIPNAGPTPDLKLIRVQITYFRLAADPQVQIKWAGGDTGPTPVPAVPIPAGNGWLHAKWDFEITCSSEEAISISCAEIVYIDQVVVDTICNPDRRFLREEKPPKKRVTERRRKGKKQGKSGKKTKKRKKTKTGRKKWKKF